MASEYYKIGQAVVSLLRALHIFEGLGDGELRNLGFFHVNRRICFHTPTARYARCRVLRHGVKPYRASNPTHLKQLVASPGRVLPHIQITTRARCWREL